MSLFLRLVVCVLLFGIAAQNPLAVHAVEQELFSNTTVDARTLTFAEGPAARFGWTVSKGVLSSYFQAAPTEVVQTDLADPVDGLPSPLHVMDNRLK